LWSHLGTTTELQHVPGVGIFDPWLNNPSVPRKLAPLAPKNMFGRSMKDVLRSPDLPDPNPNTCLNPLSPHTYSPDQSRPSFMIIDHMQSRKFQGLSHDAGIEEVRRHLGDRLQLVNGLESSSADLACSHLVPPNSSSPTVTSSFTPYAVDTANQGVAGRSTPERALSLVLSHSSQGSSLPEPSPSPSRGTRVPTHLLTQQLHSSSVNTADGDTRLADSHSEDLDIRQRRNSRQKPAFAFGDDVSESDSDEQRRTPCRRGKKTDKKVYHCPKPGCTATFTRSNDVTRHLLNASVHKWTAGDTSTRCRKCGEELSRPDARKRHELKDSCGKRKINRKPPHPFAS